MPGGQMRKTEYISIRCSPKQKQLLHTLAKQEGRTISNLVLRVMEQIAAQLRLPPRKTKLR